MRKSWIVAAAVCLGACGGAPDIDATKAGYALQARPGTYNDGSGRLGLAVLATLRDASGAGPELPWRGTLADTRTWTKVDVQYAAPGAGSYALWWWAEVPPGEVPFALALGPADAPTHEQTLPTAAGPSLGLAQPQLSPDGARLSWAPVDGASAYLCRIRSSSGLVEQFAEGEACDLAALPPGAYSASVLALSADPRPIADSTQQSPPLPVRLDVSEARLAFAKRDASAPALRLLAAGGAYDDGVSQRALAVWLSLTDAGGTATPEAWTVRVVGPGLSPSAPLTFTYAARLPRTLVWAPSVRAAQGSYSLTATSASGLALSAQFSVGVPAVLPTPMGVSAQDAAQGGATATWSPVDGARSYLASVFDGANGTRVASAWVASPAVQFPAGTFTAGRTYDVYVAASDADMTGGTPPAQVSVAENVFDFASFTAR